jgi:hypothetical protein
MILVADGRLQRDLEHLARDQLAHALDQNLAALVGEVAMDDHRKRVHRLARDQHVQPHHRRDAISGQMVIERRVAARRALQPVVEIEHDLVQRQLVESASRARADVFELLLHAALLFEQRQNAAQILLARDHGGVDDRLFDLFDLGGIGKTRRVVDFDHFIVAWW